MSKREAHLDVEEDEEDELVQNSEDEDAQNSRFSKLGSKRRRLADLEDRDEDLSEEEDADDISDSEHDAGDSRLSSLGRNRRKAAYTDNDGASDDDERSLQDADDQEDETDPTTATSSKPSSIKAKVLTRAQLEKAQRKAKKSGVIYLSRIPPFMKPHTLKNLLSVYGTLGRTYLTPEPPSQYQARVKAGGNKKKSYIDGWVEFESKKKAKICAETLNGNTIGGKPRSFYREDIWNVKYLRGFKWNDLMAQVQNEERERAGRMQAEIARETRERKSFLDNVERAKIARTNEERRLKREGSKSDQSSSKALSSGSSAGQRGAMTFRQNAVKKKDAEQVMPKKVLASLF